jgi:glycosyltransferase involved in cell wall biosynthesis
VFVSSKRIVVLVILEPARTEMGYVSKYIPLMKKHIDSNLFEIHVIGSYLGIKALKENFSDVHSVTFCPMAPRGIGLYIGYISYLFFVFFKGIRFTAKTGAHVLVSLGGHVYSGFVVALISNLLNRKSIIRISEPTRYIVRSRYFLGPLVSSFIKVFERFSFSMSTVVISNRDMRWYSDKIGGKQVVLSQGVDLSKFNPEVNHVSSSKAFPILITVSRLDKQKNIDSVIEAVGLLKNKYPEILYCIVGSGPDEAYLRDKVANLSLDKHVFFYGQASPENIPNLLRSCNLFVLSSFIEGLPSAVLEAMACGLPIIIGSTRFGWKEWFADGENALVVRSDSRSIAEAIVRLTSDDELRGKLIENGEIYVRKHHNSSRTKQQFTAIVKQLLKNDVVQK